MTTKHKTIKRHAKTVKKILYAIAILLVVSSLSYLLRPYSYNLEKSASLLPPINQTAAKKLVFDDKEEKYTFNNGQSFQSPELIQTGASNIAAAVYREPSKGVTVTDSVNKVDLSLAPKFSLNLVIRMATVLFSLQLTGMVGSSTRCKALE